MVFGDFDLAFACLIQLPSGSIDQFVDGWQGYALSLGGMSSAVDDAKVCVCVCTHRQSRT